MVEADLPTHAGHDPLLVAALVDRDLAGSELERARSLVATCTACAELHADLVSLALATRELPTPARPRDFRLSPADVERLQPNVVRRVLALIGSSRDAFSRPLAVGLTTLGLAGLLVATVPSAVPSGGQEILSAVGDAIDRDGTNLYSLSAAPAAENQAATAAPMPAAPPQAAGGEATGEQLQEEPAGRDTAADRVSADAPTELAPDPTGVSALIVVSGSLLIIGLGLFALRWTSRRFGG